MKKEDQVLVAGIGSTIRGDDGVGIYLARRLKEILPPRFDIKELTTGNLNLMDVISGYGKVILIDAIQTTDGKPGQVYRFPLEGLKYSSNLSSAHGFDLRQVIELESKLMGRAVPAVEVLAVEAGNLDEFSEDLSPELKGRFDEIAETVRAQIETEN